MIVQQQRRRRHVSATTGETIRTIAARELPDQADGAQQLLSWNLHLTLRREPVGPDGALLGTDIVYLEAPLT
jgi:hypothetical protein